jgi:hypothetical protein
MTQHEYSDYVADCAARGKREETEKGTKLAETIAVAVAAAFTAHGLPVTNVDAQEKKAKTKKQKATAPPVVDSDAVSSSDSDSAPPSPAAKAQAKRQRQKQKKKDAAALTQKVLKELLSFKDTVTELLADPASDDEGHNRVKIGQLKRHLRLAVREVEKTTPRKVPKTLPVKKATVRPLELEQEAESAVDSGAEGSSKTPYEWVVAKLGLTASPAKTVTTVAKKQTKKTATPHARLVNLTKSLEGAAREIDQEACPFPIPTEQETETLQHITATIIGMMGKHDATLKGAKRSGKATTWTVSQCMITEGLGDVIGLRIARKQTMENYLTVLLLWLLQGGTDFNADPYLQQLMADSQSMT